MTRDARARTLPGAALFSRSSLSGGTLEALGGLQAGLGTADGSLGPFDVDFHVVPLQQVAGSLAG